MINRQTQILAEMKEGLLNGYYDQKLPKTTELAQEFGVNDKTMNRVMLRLVKLPFISRKHKGETTVLKNRNLPPVIEFIYEAAQNIENHLYWMSVCQGLMSAFSAKNITLKLNRLVIQQNRMIDLEQLQLDPVSARLVIVIHEREFFEILIGNKTPFYLFSKENMVLFYQNNTTIYRFIFFA